MVYEVVESGGQWVVRHEGLEVARFEAQLKALQDVSRRLKERESAGGRASFALRFEPRQAAAQAG